MCVGSGRACCIEENELGRANCSESPSAQCQSASRRLALGCGRLRGESLNLTPDLQQVGWRWAGLAGCSSPEQSKGSKSSLGSRIWETYAQTLP